jgi:fibronectin-binding autotransporter adhesin
MSTPQSPVRRHVSSAAALLALLAGHELPAQSVWSNNTTGSTLLWSTASNWSPASAPVSGTSTVLEFGHIAAGSLVANNDISSGFQLNILRFTGSNATTINVGGSSLAFVANGGTNPEIQFNSTSTAAQTISAAMALNANTTVTSSISNATGNLQLGTLSGAGKLSVDFTTSASGAVLLAASSVNTHTGGVDLNNGRLVVANSASFGTGAVTLSGGILRTTTGATGLSFANSLNLAGNVTLFETASSAGNSLTFTNGGTVQGTAATHTLTLGKTGTILTLGGAFTGVGNGLTFAGSGTVNLGAGSSDSAANTYSGTTTVSASTVTLNLDKAAGTNAIGGGLTLASGTRANWMRANQVSDIATITVNGGTLDFASAALGDGVSETIGALTASSGTIATNASKNSASGNTITVAGATTISGASFNVNQGSTLSTSSLDLTTNSSSNRIVGGNLIVGSGGLAITQAAAGTSALTLYESPSSGVLTLNGNLTFTNSTGSTNSATITRGIGTGYIDLGGGTRTFTINDGAATDDLQVTVKVTNGGLIKEGAGALAFGNTLSDYTGNTTINGGTIRANSTTTLANQSTYALANTAGVTLDLNNFSHTIGGLSGGGATGGTVTLGTATLTAGNNNASTTYSGAITGSGGLTKTGTGSLTLASNLAYTGATLVSNGTLVVNGTLASSGLTLNGANAVLGGSGRVNALTLTQGTFGPGNSAGTFTVDGNVSFGAASIFSVEAASSASFDKLIVNGAGSTVSINSAATLALSGFSALSTLSTGTEFILIENNSTSSISGTFFGYAQGQSFTLGANTYQTSYLLGGGDNNDFGFVVTASAIPEPSTVAILAGLTVLAAATLRRRQAARQ